MIALLVEAGIWASLYIYHRYFEDGPKYPPSSAISIPKTADGTAIPMVFGKYRIRAPNLAWIGDAIPSSDPQYTGGVAPWAYMMDMFFVLGIPFGGGSGTQKIHKMWAGESKLDGDVTLEGLTGAGGHETAAIVDSGVLIGNTGFIGQRLEFLNGNPSQQLVDPVTHTSTTFSGDRLGIADMTLVPGYRGFCCALLFNGGGGVGWVHGSSSNPPRYSFEVSSYPQTGVEFYYDGGLSVAVGVEANPADVIYDVLTAVFLKLGISTSLVDITSFGAAAKQLLIEGHGYSMATEAITSAEEFIMSILKQIDAVMYEDPVDSKIKIKLIRADYDPWVAREVNVDNCTELQNFAAGGWTGIYNKVSVTFADRTNDYNDATAHAQNAANAVGQDGIVREMTQEHRGTCTWAQASAIAARELTAYSRPMIKCKAVVDRSFLRTVQGDVVALSWPEYGLYRMMMRVAGVTRGSLEDGSIVLDLIQDMFYVDASLLAHGAEFAALAGG